MCETVAGYLQGSEAVLASQGGVVPDRILLASLVCFASVHGLRSRPKGRYANEVEARVVHDAALAKAS